MTFSDTAVVDFVKKNFNAVWTSVAPVTDVVIDIGDGRKVTGATNGEIALYVCRPDGKAVDVLPGLRTAGDTLDFLADGLRLLRQTGGAEQEVRSRIRRLAYAEASKGRVARAAPPQLASVPLIDAASIAASLRSPQEERGRVRDFDVVVSKSAVVTPSESLLVAQPRTKDDLQVLARHAMAGTSLRTPDAWKTYVFETLMQQPLKGGRIDIPSATPVTVRRF